MPITEPDLQHVTDRPSLYAFLRRSLGWPVDEEDTFTYPGPRLDGEISGRVEVSQIVPFTSGDPFSIMLVEFDAAFRRTDIRETLRYVRRQVREEARYEGRQTDEFVFICPSQDYKAVWLAHFEERAGRAPRLEVFGWDQDHLHETRTLRQVNLLALTMPPKNLLDEYDWESGKRHWLAAWDVRAVTRDFFRDYKAVYNQVSSLITAVPGDAPDKQRVFTQRLLNRLLFVQFLSKRGWLRFGNRRDYLPALWQDRDPATNFYNSRLRLLFFSGLNNSQCRDLRRNNPVLFNLIGEMPFLNGGLFEEAPEDRMTPGAVVPDAAISAIIGLFEQYNFTITESTPDDVEVAVDPEMLGEVFERLVTEDERKQSGSYYTPRSIVQFMCREALKGYLGGQESLVDERKADAVLPPQAVDLLRRLQRVRVVDPACGSGAYLLGMLHELFDLMGLLEVRADPLTEADKYRRKLNIIQNNLYGVDLTGFAVETARLRLWLSLVVEDRRNPLEEECDVALPNLDYKVEQGDSLTAPAPSQTENLLRQGDVDTFNRLKREYLTAHGPDKRTRHEALERLRDELKRGSHSGQEVTGFDWAVEFGEVFTPHEAAGDMGGFDIVLANPPYGASVGDDVRDIYFDRRQTEERGQSKDTYGLFIARALQLLRPGGQFSYIVSDTWRTIKTHKPLRRRLAQTTTVRHVLDLPSWVFDGPTVNTCILTFTATPPHENHELIAGDLRNIKSGDWTTLEENLRFAAAHGVDLQTTRYARYTYKQSLIGTYDNFSLFIGSPKLYTLMSDPRFQKLGDIADVKQGLATADNGYYLRKRAGVRGSYEILDENLLLSEQEITGLSDAEKRNGVDPACYGGRHFVPYDKGGESDAEGGWLPNYFVPTGYFINWSMAAIQRLRTSTSSKQGGKIAARLQNSQFYFRQGITFSYTGFYAPNFRISSGAVFDVGGSSCFNIGYPITVSLALLASRLNRLIAKAFVDHTVNYQVDEFKELLLPKDLEATIQTRITAFVSVIIEKQRVDPRYPYHLHEQREIDALVYELYGLDADDIREVELWFCRRYPLLAQAQGVLPEVQEKYAEQLAHAARVMARPPSYWQSHPVLRLIAQEEGTRLERKETLAVDARTGAPSNAEKSGTAKAVAAFLNTQGGTLLIGVNNAGEIKGIARDLAHCNRNDTDGFEQKLRQILSDNLQPPPHGLVTVAFVTLPEGILCRVDVPARPGITYLNGTDVYVRDGNRSPKLEGRILVEWSEQRQTG